MDEYVEADGCQRPSALCRSRPTSAIDLTTSCYRRFGSLENRITPGRRVTLIGRASSSDVSSVSRLRASNNPVTGSLPAASFRIIKRRC